MWGGLVNPPPPTASDAALRESRGVRAKHPRPQFPTVRPYLQGRSSQFVEKNDLCCGDPPSCTMALRKKVNECNGSIQKETGFELR